MKDKEHLKRTNTDILGNRWLLAPGGRDRLDKCVNRLWDLRTELTSYGILFRHLGNDCAMEGDDLYGIGVSLERTARRITKISNQLSKVMVSEDEYAENDSSDEDH